jgi:hypothetical protein
MDQQHRELHPQKARVPVILHLGREALNLILPASCRALS